MFFINLKVAELEDQATQLDGIYGPSNAKTIVNNCDNLLYLGGQDIDTARYISLKTNRPLSDILDMPLDRCWLLTRGRRARLVEKFDLKEHSSYSELCEDRRSCFTDLIELFGEPQTVTPYCKP